MIVGCLTAILIGDRIDQDAAPKWAPLSVGIWKAAPDLSHFVVGSRDSWHLYNRDGQRVKTLGDRQDIGFGDFILTASGPVDSHHARGVWAFSKDSKLLMWGARMKALDLSSLKWINLATVPDWENRFEPADIYGIALEDGIARYNRGTGQELFRLPPIRFMPGIAPSASAVSSKIAFVNYIYAESTAIWDLEKREFLTELPGLMPVAPSRDGNFAIYKQRVTDNREPFEVCGTVDLATGERRELGRWKVLPSGPKTADKMGLSSDDRYGWFWHQGFISVYDMTSGEKVNDFATDDATGWHPLVVDGQLIYGTASEIKGYDIASGDLTLKIRTWDDWWRREEQ